MEINGFIILFVYWAPIYFYLIVWSIKVRYHYKKNGKKLADRQKLAEVIVYAIALFFGFFYFIDILPKKIIKNNIMG